MKKTTILIMAILFAAIHSLNAGNECDSLLKKVIVSDPDYGNYYYGYGNPKCNVFRSKDSSQLLVFQTSYGGDGDHTPNILKIFKFKGDSSEKLIDINIDSVSFIKESYYLKTIRGHSVYTLCDVCDGWDAALPEDNFFVPIIIDVESLKIKADLTKQEKKEFLIRFDQQANNNIKELLSYGRNNYPKYVEEVKSEIIKLLTQ